jgi:ABC-type branched-subunit amino acid transport system substrate-binding protein
MAIHSILPPALADVVESVLRDAGLTHVAHGDRDPVAAAEAVVADPEARAAIGPFRSRAVAEVVEVTAPAGLPLLAPVATWAGVTRSDEPGCEDDPARHLGTVLRLVARDTVVAQRIATRVRDAGRRALVVAGDHGYGAQLDGQLALAGLPRAGSAGVSRTTDLDELRRLGGFDEHGDPLDPPVRFERYEG